MAKAKDKAEMKEAFYDIIQRPVITEKATAMSEHNKIVFRVRPDATKAQVKQAVQSLFNVEVTKVNTITLPGKVKQFRGKPGQRQGSKKAVVTLAQGQSIDLASGVA